MFQDSVFTFKEVSISVLQDKGCGSQRTPHHPSPVQEARLSQCCPVDEAALCRETLHQGWRRWDSPQDAAHPFAEVAARF